MNKKQKRASKGARKAKPQYHYFYGSTDEVPLSPQISEGGDTLLGESLVPTDTEEEGMTLNTSNRDLRQLVVSNGGRGLYQLGEAQPLSTYSTNGAHKKKHTDCFAFCLDSVLNVDGIHPVGHITRITIMVSLVMLICTLIMVLNPLAPRSLTGGTHSGRTPSLQVPFPIVDRANFHDEAAGIVRKELFDPSLLFNAGKKNARTGGHFRSNTEVDPFLKVPFPTGAFWTNLVLHPTDDGFSYPIVSYPYAFKWSDSILQASYPAIRRKISSSSIRDSFEPDISFGTSQEIAKRHVTRFDALSVTLRFYTTGSGYWESYVVQGSPYITVKYNDATPILKALSTFQQVMCPFDSDGNYYDGDGDSVDGLLGGRRKLKWGVCTPSNGSGNDSTAVLHGVQFLIQTQENMTWILFSSELIELSFDAETRTEIVASKKFSGVLRLALIPPTAEFLNGNFTGLLPLSVSTGLKRLVYHAGLYPVGGSVSWEFKSSPTQSAVAAENAIKAIVGGTTVKPTPSSTRAKLATVQFKYQTLPLNQNSNSKLQLLMLGLPHHEDVLQPEVLLGQDEFDLSYKSIKGKMTPVVGSTWSYDEKLTMSTIDHTSDLRFDRNVADLILQNVQNDAAMLVPQDNLNVYGYGKQLARLAQLAHITNVILNEPTNSTSRLLHEITTNLQQSLVKLFEGDVVDQLLYDAKFGGIVSKNGIADASEDFGNGRFNDHHFHYGYILYASAILGNLNTSFVHEYGDFVDSLLYDISYRANGDSLVVDSVFFPLARYKSWYDGHSFASGLFPYANGKSQESSSEAVNGYYGAYLWCLLKSRLGVGETTDFKDFLRLLLAMEIRGAKTYWHMLPPTSTNSTRTRTQPSSIYSPSFTRNYMVGNLGMLDVVASTYFAKELFYVHLINLLPVTAITPELFGQTFVSEQYYKVIAKSDIPMAWKGYAVCNHALVAPMSAWEEAQELVSEELDSALSKSQVLYFISTQQGFQSPDTGKTTVKRDQDDDISVVGGKQSSGDDDYRSQDESPGSDSAKCDANPDCANLSGYCCPTEDGKMLACCE